MIKQLTQPAPRTTPHATRTTPAATRLKHSHHIKGTAGGKFAVYDAQQRFRARFNSYAEAEAYVQAREQQHRRK